MHRCAVGYARKHGVDVLRVLRLPYNRGKGFAVKSGALVARGEGSTHVWTFGIAWIICYPCSEHGVPSFNSGAAVLIMDADGATRVADLELLETALKKLLVQGL